MSAVGSYRSIRISWTNDSARDVVSADVWAATANDRSLGVLVGSPAARPGTVQTFVHANLDPGVTRYYWVRNVDSSGNSGDFFPTSPTDGWSATAEGLPSGDGVIPWIEVTSSPFDMVPNTGYIASMATLCQLRLPAISALGDVNEVVGKGAGGWEVTQRASQSIITGDVETTSGTGGSLLGGHPYAQVRLRTVTADLRFAAELAYTDEQAQDAIGAMLDASMYYTDATPLLGVNPASNTLAGIVELATTSETSTGTDSGRAVSPATLAGSIFGTVTLSVEVHDSNSATALTTGDAKRVIRVPKVASGMNLTYIAMHVATVSSSGIPTFQLRNVTDSVDMLSTKITVDQSEHDSLTAATAAVIDTSHDDVVEGDELAFDCDVAGTGTKGVTVELQFQLP